MPIALLIAGVCFFVLAGVHSLWQFYVAYIIARAIANPNLVGVVPRTVAVNFFRRKRGLSLGLTSMARPVSGAINIQIIAWLATVSSWRTGYSFLGILSLILIVPVFLIMRRRPEDIGLLPDGDSRPDASAIDSTTQRSSPAQNREFSWHAGEAALTYSFWFIVIAESLMILMAGSFSFQIVPFLISSDVSPSVATVALSISSMLGAFVNPGWGFLSDKYPPRRLALIATLVTGISMLLLLVISDGGALFFIVIFWGTASGGLNILGSMMLAQYFGRGSYGSITGLVGPFQTGALGLGPTFGALLFNRTGGYTSLFIFALFAYGISLVLIYAARRPKLPARATANELAADD